MLSYFYRVLYTKGGTVKRWPSLMSVIELVGHFDLSYVRYVLLRMMVIDHRVYVFQLWYQGPSEMSDFADIVLVLL